MVSSLWQATKINSKAKAVTKLYKFPRYWLLLTLLVRRYLVPTPSTKGEEEGGG